MEDLLNKYNLEERTQRFARDCRDYCRKLPKTIENFEYRKQLVRSSGSTAANYIEANEALSYKDFVHRIRICRKEVKESRLWLNLCLIDENQELKIEKQRLLNESFELTKIFSATIRSCENKMEIDDQRK
jgi:four helix bundle protein